MSGFGECVACGCPVERAGWDELCFRCQESEKAEMVDPYDERDADDGWPSTFDEAVRGIEARGRDRV